ncbi:hypothetical protein DFO57_11320 [Pantoea sp. AG702]|nr:hypothetical protein DFO57_11320 [Pantoea sp. AG702]
MSTQPIHAWGMSAHSISYQSITSEEYMHKIQTNADDEGRIVALQVGFAALVDLWGRDNPEMKSKLIAYLESTGMDPENKKSSSSFHELIEVIRGLEDMRG